MFSLFKKPEEEIVAVFDIGNGSIGGALVKFQQNGLPVVLYTHREPITFTSHATPKHLLGHMLKLLKSVATHLAKDGLIHLKTSPFGGHRLRDAYCVFASPWYISQTKVIKTNKEHDFTITKEVVNELVKKEQDAFNQAMKEGKYVEIFGPDAKLLEKRIINMKLNGYSVEDPFGKEAKELELTLFSSFMSQEILAQVEDTLHACFAVRNVHHSSYALVSWSGAELMFPDIHDYMFIDVSGETTDISLVVKDVLVETMSFPMGRSTLLRKVVRELNVTPEVGLSYLTMRYAGTLDKRFSDKLGEVLMGMEEDWRDACFLMLGNFQKQYTLPRAVLMTADSDTAGFFTGALGKPTPTELNVPQNNLAVTFIGPDKVKPFLYELENVGHDAFLGIESIFLNQAFKQQR